MTESIWPNDCRGAVSLTFDDGMPSQLRKAVPWMNERDLRGTFYMSFAGDNWAKAAEAWRPVHDTGHEIGNHSLTHTCSRAMSADLGAHGLELMTLDEMEAEVLEAEQRLDGLFPRESRSFCYPCYQSYVGHGLTRQSYVPLIAKHFVAGRGLGERSNSPFTSDLHYLWGWDVARMTGANLVGLAEQSVSQGRWGIIILHGIDSGHLPMAGGDLIEFLDHLHLHRDRIWTAPVADVADWLTNLRDP